MKRRLLCLPLAFTVVTVLTACNLSSSPVGTATSVSPRPTETAFPPATGVPTATIAPPETATPTPTSEPARPMPVDLSSFPGVSWMARLSLTQGWAYSGRRLLWTDDAGASWSDITPAGLSNCAEPDICLIVSPPVFLDSSRVRIAVIRGQESVPPTALSFMYTDNGGKTWGLRHITDYAYPQDCPGPACISGADLEFADSQNGWLAAYASLGMSSDMAYLYRTQDGGQTWSALEMPVSGGISFVDSMNGWAVGGETHWTSDQLLRTQDGGNSWQPVSLDFPESYTDTGYDFQVPAFLSHDVGALPVRFYRDEDINQLVGFYTTQNSGGDWSLAATLQERDLNTFGRGSPIPWSAIDESTWFVAVSEGKQYLTRNRGQIWEVFAAAGLAGAKLLDVQFASVSEGWGLGMTCDKDYSCKQLLFATHDGGHTWTPLAPVP